MSDHFFGSATTVRLMSRLQAEFAQRRAVGPQLVGNPNLGDTPCFLSSSHQLLGRMLVAPRLDQDIENLAFRIDSGYK